MDSTLLTAASKVIPLTELLVNVVSRRVRQLNQGHRPLVTTPPGMGIADIALTEIIQGKLTSAPAVIEAPAAADIVIFPGVIEGKKKKAA